VIEIVFASTLKSFEGWSAAVLAVVGVGSLVATALAVVQQRWDARRARTFEYVRRLYDLEFASLNTRVLLFLQTGDEAVFLPDSTVPSPPSRAVPDEKKIEAFEGLSLDYANKITLVLNFYEELSGSYRRKLLDPGVADNMLLPVALVAWPLAHWLIDYEREKLRIRYKGAHAEEVMEEWQGLVANHSHDSHSMSFSGRVRALGRHLNTLLIPLAGILAILGLLVVGLAADSFRDVAASFLFAAAAVCLVLGAATLAQSLSPSPMRRALLVSAAVAATLSVGITSTLALTASLGPPGPHGSRGATGKDGQQGPRGRDGLRGAEGRRGARGERGREGTRGPEGGPGPRGPRGVPGFVGS
jgi:Collagen triple helix repeat (20 copies)